VVAYPLRDPYKIFTIYGTFNDALIFTFGQFCPTVANTMVVFASKGVFPLKFSEFSDGKLYTDDPKLYRGFEKVTEVQKMIRSSSITMSNTAGLGLRTPLRVEQFCEFLCLYF